TTDRAPHLVVRGDFASQEINLLIDQRDNRFRNLLGIYGLLHLFSDLPLIQPGLDLLLVRRILCLLGDVVQVIPELTWSNLAESLLCWRILARFLLHLA